jgi:hypothetical protein
LLCLQALFSDLEEWAVEEEEEESAVALRVEVRLKRLRLLLQVGAQV